MKLFDAQLVALRFCTIVSKCVSGLKDYELHANETFYMQLSNDYRTTGT